jgi:hypothetical protein
MKYRSLKRLLEALDLLSSYYPPNKPSNEGEIMLKSLHSVTDESYEGLETILRTVLGEGRVMGDREGIQ